MNTNDALDGQLAKLRTALQALNELGIQWVSIAQGIGVNPVSLYQWTQCDVTPREIEDLFARLDEYIRSLKAQLQEIRSEI